MSVRYQVKSIGGMWRVIDRATGKTRAFRQRYVDAIALAQSWDRSGAAMLSILSAA